MFGFFIVILILISILLIAVVLLQPGKGDMASGLGALGGQFSSVLGTRRAADLLTKLTIGFAAAIILLSLVTNLMFVGKVEEKAIPVTQGATLPSTTPVNPADQTPPPIPPPTEPDGE